MLEDKLLLCRMKRGSSEALSRIYKRYKNDMLALALSLLYDKTTSLQIEVERRPADVWFVTEVKND